MDGTLTGADPWRKYAQHVLVGRTAELARIDALLEDARAGRGAVLVLTGEPGVGKSALLRAAAERASGLRVLRATGIEYEAELPFSGLHELLHPVLPLVEDLPGPQSAALRGALAMSDEPVDRFAAFAAVFGLLAAASADAPLLVAIDDAQWLDAASLEALGFAARRLSGEGVAILAAFRDEVAPGFRAPSFGQLSLEGLEPDAIVALVGREAERPLSANLVERLARATHGNPLAALEVAAAVSDDRVAARLSVGEPLPPGRVISAAFERRLAQLSEPARHALLLAAAGESESAHVVLAAAGRLSLHADAFAEAERAGAIAVEDDRVRFRHPLLRSLAYRGPAAEVRRRAHGALASSLTAAPGIERERRAWHLAAATVAPDEEVAAELAAAAEHFANRAGYLAAAYAYERAAELTPEAARRGERLAEAAEATRLAGRPARARELLGEAEALAEDPALRADIAFKQAKLETWLGSVEVAAQRYARLADDVTDPDRAAQALSHSAGAAVAAGDTETALASAQRAAELLGTVSESTACTVRETLGAVLVLRGRPAEGAPLLREAAAWFEANDDLPSRDYVAQALLWVEDYALARRLLAPLLAHARRVGDLRALMSALEIQAQLEFRTGHWRAAHSAAEESARLSADTGLTVHEAYSLGVLAIVEAARGVASSAEHAARADEIAARSRLSVIAEYTGAARGLDALGRGQPHDALTHLEAVAERVARTGRRQPGVLQWEADLLEAAVRADRLDAAALGAFERQAQDTGNAWAAAVAARIRGLIADDYRPHFEQALSHDGGQFEAARTRFGWGQRLRRDGLRIEAREQLHAALEGFRTLGAAPWAGAAERELGASGEKLRRRTPEAEEELTVQEQQIAELVVAGASNKDVAAQLFLSTKTVEAHLTRIYRKLGVNSRTQLARATAAR
jgi:DNA-binding CsgD family transcriptional regulator